MSNAPLAGLKVLDFGHTVMGPSCGLVLADLGAEVVRIEPVKGDPTRKLGGFGAGFFAFFNRNKDSVALDLKSPDARPAIEAALRWADVLIENFGPGTMERLGLGFDEVKAINPRLVYCALKGFLPGPYEHRPALDEVVQMMGGLAWMTGPPGQPMRAGTSVVDLTGGIFGVVGILAALRQRDVTGIGGLVQSSLFESVAFLVGQHMAVTGVTGAEVRPMAQRSPTWGIYDVFDVADGQVFIGVTSDQQWPRFCSAFAFEALGADVGLVTNQNRVDRRASLLPELRALLLKRTVDEVASACEAANVSFAPIRRPVDLFDDPHLKANGSLLPIRIGDRETALPAIPIRINHAAPGRPSDPPILGQGTRTMLAVWGLGDDVISDLIARGVAGEPARG
jgi:crotonobetainyl-CoA:carnitine CoA-transferase CaiB-like acyl-CoA transferase